MTQFSKEDAEKILGYTLYMLGEHGCLNDKMNPHTLSTEEFRDKINVCNLLEKSLLDEIHEFLNIWLKEVQIKGNVL